MPRRLALLLLLAPAAAFGADDLTRATHQLANPRAVFDAPRAPDGHLYEIAGHDDPAADEALDGAISLHGIPRATRVEVRDGEIVLVE